jgi:threonyl-tRNA synthetase
MVILGKKEEESGKITIRDRKGKQTHGLAIDDFIKQIATEIKERSFSNEP